MITATLIDREIIDLVEQGKLIKMETFEKKNCKGVFYDLRVGHKAILIKSQKHIEISDEKPLSISPQECVKLCTEEEILMNEFHFGRIYSKTGLTSEGLSNISTTIDPGFEGPLWISICNHGYNPITLKWKSSFCKLEISSIIQKPDQVYSKDYPGHFQKALENPPRTEIVEDWKPTPISDINDSLIEEIRQKYGPPFDILAGKFIQIENKIRVSEGINKYKRILLYIIITFMAACIGTIFPFIASQYLNIFIFIIVIGTVMSIIGIKILKL